MAKGEVQAGSVGKAIISDRPRFGSRKRNGETSGEGRQESDTEAMKPTMHRILNSKHIVQRRMISLTFKDVKEQEHENEK